MKKPVYFMEPNTGAVATLSDWRECYYADPMVIHGVDIVNGKQVDRDWTFESYTRDLIEVRRTVTDEEKAEFGDWMEASK